MSQKSALVIGNGNYENVQKLKNPTNDSEDISSECIDLHLIERRFSNANSKANIFILDSCRDNPFEMSMNIYAQSRNIVPKID